MECQVTCADNTTVVTQLCQATVAGRLPRMVTTSTACPLPSTTTMPPTSAASTLSPSQRAYISHAIVFTQDFPANTTEESLMADAGFMSSLQASLFAGVNASMPELSGSLVQEDIIIKQLTLSDARRLREVARSPGRRLAPKTLNVAYEIAVPAAMTSSAKALGEAFAAKMADPTSLAAFNEAVKAKYVETETVRTGTAPAVTVVASTIVSTVTPAPPTTAAPPAPAPVPAPVPAPRPPAPAPSPAPAPVEEVEDNSGTVLGIIVGAVAGCGILGVFFYLYNSKKQAGE